MGNSEEITDILLAHRNGDSRAFRRLVSFVYDDLRRIAHHQLRRVRPRGALDTTGLVHEAYVKLVGRDRVSWCDRSHFFAAAAQAMRHIIVDHARLLQTEKRGGGRDPLPLDEGIVAADQELERMLALDQALERLEQVDPRMVRVVECRFFAGLTEDETAQALGISARTVGRTWIRARGWLRELLGSTLDSKGAGGGATRALG